MAESTAKARRVLEGHRRAIRDHIAKYERYTDQHDKEFALKTVRRVQGRARALVRKHPTLANSWEDGWSPRR